MAVYSVADLRRNLLIVFLEQALPYPDLQPLTNMEHFTAAGLLLLRGDGTPRSRHVRTELARKSAPEQKESKGLVAIRATNRLALRL